MSADAKKKDNLLGLCDIHVAAGPGIKDPNKWVLWVNFFSDKVSFSFVDTQNDTFMSSPFFSKIGHLLLRSLTPICKICPLGFFLGGGGSLT